MLSTQAIKNAAEAAHYFMGEDNYYTEGGTLAEERSQWWGKGAEVLGLSGSVGTVVFTDVLTGKLPNGVQLGNVVNNQISHRPGFDLTFSAPKSVSLLAVLGGDERILRAVTRATDVALALVERDLAKARMTRRGETTYPKTGNLVVARFLHDLSRDGDPQLHTHCAVANATQRRDGEWRSLASTMGKYGTRAAHAPDGFFEAVRHHKKYYGAVFRAELAYEMTQLGYAITKGRQGFFEVTGISQAVLQAYSQRREEIEAFMRAHAFSGAKAAAMATLATRQKKQHIDRATLMAHWHAKATLFSVPAFEEVQSVVADALRQKETGLSPTAASPSVRSEAAQKAVLDAIAHLSETQVAMREAAIIHQASQCHAGEAISITALLAAFAALQQSGEVLVLPMYPEFRGETHVTTAALVAREKDVLQHARTPHASGNPVVDRGVLRKHLDNQTEFTSEQRHALTTLFSSPQQVLVLEGPTGSGKTHLLKPMMALAEWGGYRPCVLTPSKAHSMDLEKQLKDAPGSLWAGFKGLFENGRCETVAGFLHRQQNANALDVLLQKKPMVFVENATLLPLQQWHALAMQVTRAGGRLVALGDAKSALPWQAGSPFMHVLAHGATVAHLTHPLHQAQTEQKKQKEQKEQQAQKKEGRSLPQAALRDAQAGQFAAAFEKLGPRLVAIENAEARLDAMATQYVGMEPTARQQTCLLLPTQRACEAMNARVREKLKARGEITPQETSITVWLPRPLTPVAQRYAPNYHTGQWVRFNSDYLSLRVQRGDYRKIVGIDVARNRVLLENATGRVRRWDPARLNKVEVFDAKPRAVASGDTLVWRRTDIKKGWVSGTRVTVTAVDARYLGLLREDGKTLKVDHREPAACHFEYGHAFTFLQKYHARFDTVMAHVPRFVGQQRRVYALLGQAKQQMWVYTDDAARLLNHVQTHTGDKRTAIGALLEAGKDAPGATDALEQRLATALARAHGRLQAPTPEGVAKDAVGYALAHLGEREAAFPQKDVLTTALQHALGQVPVRKVEKAIAHAEKKADLLRGVSAVHGTQWTTQTALQLERDTVSLALAGRGQCAPLFAHEQPTVAHYLRDHPLSAEQADTLRRLAQNTDRTVLIHGFAGTRKTTLLTHVQSLLGAERPLLCLAPTHTAVKELTARGLTAQTLDRFLAHTRLFSAPSASSSPFVSPISSSSSSPQRPCVIAIDEASLVSMRRLHGFLQVIQARDIRTVIMGDPKQYGAIEAGRFALLQRAGVPTVYLKDITRQQDATVKAAVAATYQGNFAQAFQVLEKNTVAVGSALIDGKKVDDRMKRLTVMRDDYLSRTPEQRAQTLVVTLGNEDRVLFNALVREGLQEKGELVGEVVACHVLVPRHMSEVERTRVSNYALGEVVRFDRADTALGLDKGQYWIVAEIHKPQNGLALRRESSTVFWKPAQLLADGTGVEVYQRAEREVQVGDVLRWTRTDKAANLLGSDVLRVDAIQNGQWFLQRLDVAVTVPVHAKETKETNEEKPEKGDAERNRVQITPREARFQHWDHAYAMTGYTAQGRTVSDVMVHAESFRPQLTSQPSFLVAITRAVHRLTLYTDDKAALLSAIQGNRGEKTSALETRGEFPYLPVPATGKAIKTPSAVAEAKAPRADRTTQKAGRPHGALPRGKRPVWDASRVYQALLQDAERVVEHLLGKPHSHANGQYRYGHRHGSLVVTLVGEKRGLWHDFQTGEGGNLLGLIATRQGLSLKHGFTQVLEKASELTGLSGTERLSSSSPPVRPVATQAAGTLTPAQWKSRAYARQLARESKPVVGTVAERYLREHRHIPLAKFPSSVRFHPRIYSKQNDGVHPALVVIATDAHAKVQAVQAIFLDPATAQKADVPVNKQTWGAPSKGAVRLGKTRPHAPTYLAEGVETALSVYAAVGGDVRATLGKSNFKHVTDTARHVVLCLDNDGEGSGAFLHPVAEKWKAAGKQVWAALPTAVGYDYNDVLKTQGLDVVRDALARAVPCPASEGVQKSTAVTLASAVLRDRLGLPPLDTVLPLLQKEGALPVLEHTGSAPTEPTRPTTHRSFALPGPADQSAIQRNRGEKTSALETRGEFPYAQTGNVKSLPRPLEKEKEIEREHEL